MTLDSLLLLTWKRVIFVWPGNALKRLQADVLNVHILAFSFTSAEKKSPKDVPNFLVLQSKFKGVPLLFKTVVIFHLPTSQCLATETITVLPDFSAVI